MSERKKRILLVDDSEDHRAIIVRAFSEVRLGYGVELLEAASVTEAKEKLQEQLFDAALVDWRLEDGSGTELLPGYEEEPTVPIVLMTGYGDEEAAVDALKKGAIDFIVKSDDSLRQMPQIVDRALRVWELRQRERFFRTKLGSHQRMAELGLLAGSVIAHEMSNLINALQNYGETLRRELHLKAYDKSLSTLHHMHECAGKCAQIIEHMRAFARDSRPQSKLFDIEEAIRSRVELLKPIIPSNIEIEWQVDVSGRYCYADIEQFHSVIMNLITNARDAIGKRFGAITISLRTVKFDNRVEKGRKDLESGLFHCLEIIDNGVGVTRADMEHLFEPFFSQKSSGMGLGLATAKRFVESVEGAIEVESKYGSGTTFRIWLPVAAAVPVEVPPELDLRFRGSGQTILLLDDESWFLDSTTKLLEGSGYQVEAFRDAEKALEFLSDPPPPVHLLIVDQNMPRMKGTDFMRRVRERGFKTPSLLVTGYSDVVDRAQARRAGYQEFLEKPVDPHRLGTLVHELIVPPSKTVK